MEIEKRRYKMIKRLGESSRNQIFLIGRSDEEVVFKRILKKSIADATIFHIFLNERPNHFEKIIRVIEYSQYFDIFEEYIKGLTVAEILADEEDRVFHIDELTQWFSQLYFALKKIHKRQPYPIIHGDVSPSNMMIDCRGNAHLLDLQSAIEIKSEEDYIRDRIFITYGYASKKKQEQFIVNEDSDLYGLARTFHFLFYKYENQIKGEKERIKRIKVVFEKIIGKNAEMS